MSTSTATPARPGPVLDAYRAIARRRPNDRVRVRTWTHHLDLIVTSVHAGESADIGQAYLTGRALAVPVTITVTAANIAAGFYWLTEIPGGER